MIDNEYCGVCEQCVPKCPKDLIIKIGYTMKVRDGCDDSCDTSYNTIS